jgi:hypothetical protein
MFLGDFTMSEGHGHPLVHISNVSNWIVINESPNKTNENITNLISHEYMEGSFLFNRKFMRIFFYIFMIRKFELLNKHAIISIDC